MSDFDQTSLRDELEIRVIALLTGELSETEADQLETILANDAELSAFRDRMAELMGELHDGRDELADAENEPHRQLSEARRAKIFGDVSVLDAKPKSKKIWLNPALWGVAASIAMVFFISALSTVKFVQHSFQEEAVFQAVSVDSLSPTLEPEYEVNIRQRSSSTPPPGQPSMPHAIAVNNPSDLDIPDLDIDVAMDGSSVSGPSDGNFSGRLSGVREKSVPSRDRLDNVDTDFFKAGETIPVDIPVIRIEGTPQPIREPNLERRATEAPRMVVRPSSELAEEKEGADRADFALDAVTTYSDFGNSVKAKQDVQPQYRAKGNVASLGLDDAVAEQHFSEVRGISSRTSPDPFSANASGSVPVASQPRQSRSGGANGAPVEPFGASPGRKQREDISGVAEWKYISLAGGTLSNGKIASDSEMILEGSLDADFGFVDRFSAQPINKPTGQVSADRQSEVAQLSKDGRALFLHGDYEAAAEVFEGVEAIQPGNAEAKLFSKRIHSIKNEISEDSKAKSREGMLTKVDLSWETPHVFNENPDSSISKDSAYRGKLNEVVIPQVNFSGMPLSKVVETIEELSAVYDPEGKGLDLKYESVDGHDPKVNITLRNLSVDRILEFVTQQVNYSYDVGSDAITIQPSHGLAGVSNYKKEFIPISRETLALLIATSDGGALSEPVENPFALRGAAVPNAETRALQSFFQGAGVNQELPGASLAFDGEKLIVTQTPRNIERIRKIISRYEEKNKAEVAARNVRLTPKPEKLAAEEPFSTFSLNISDVSFKLAQAALENSRVPPKAQIRTEEFVNSFDYGDPAPRPNEPVALNWEIAQHPFEHDRQVVRFSLQTQASGRTSGQPLNISLLVDNSGSMQRPDRRAILENSLRTLEAKLTPQDNLNIILFARQPRLIAEAQTRASQKAAVASALAYRPEGGTNLEAGLQAAYETAGRNFLPNGSNRVIVMTDGAANLGNVNASELAEYVVEQRKQGIALDAYGIGWDDYNDALLEEITRNGDGRYAFLNSVEEASDDFSEKLAGTLRVAASNVKVQIEWNPDRVKRYRQIGYDLHQLKKEDFRDNTVDAAEIGEAESGTALYVMKIDEDPKIIGGLGTLHVRYLDPASGLYKERSWPLPMPRQIPAAKAASPSMRLAMTSAFFGERLADSPYAGGYGFNDLYKMTSGLPEAFPKQPRVTQMQSMLLQASELYGESK